MIDEFLSSALMMMGARKAIISFFFHSLRLFCCFQYQFDACLCNLRWESEKMKQSTICHEYFNRISHACLRNFDIMHGNLILATFIMRVSYGSKYRYFIQNNKKKCNWNLCESKRVESKTFL